MGRPLSGSALEADRAVVIDIRQYLLCIGRLPRPDAHKATTWSALLPDAVSAAKRLALHAVETNTKNKKQGNRSKKMENVSTKTKERRLQQPTPPNLPPKGNPDRHRETETPERREDEEDRIDANEEAPTSVTDPNQAATEPEGSPDRRPEQGTAEQKERKTEWQNQTWHRQHFFY
ncbi:hypothetical protein FJT64_010214 [Amphibalanus amphitrite]|uniref:Uncharacterized protein n=1 Tax=Amphibalanus amphitrite TaxID=1232801 RepID=A0A6A4VEY4_AMPAM|nr:hypothetical protein FJT64_010214 [Amphibalanus amphitrite]